MNDRGKLNLGAILIGLAAVVIISIGAFSLASRASDNAIPKAPVLQADTPSGGDQQAPEEEAASEEKPATEETAVSEEKPVESTDTPPAEESADDSGKSHRDQTPSDLTSLGIYFKDDEGSPVAERTKKILEVNLAQAIHRKNDAAREYLTVNAEGRADPLYVTDMIPDALRPELQGEGITGAIDSGLIDQLMQTRISTIFKYMPIEIIGTMQNGPYKSVLLTIPGLYYGILTEGRGFSIPAFGGEQGVYYINMSIAYIAEDQVTINFSASMYDYNYGRLLSTTPTVKRNFYIRRFS